MTARDKFLALAVVIIAIPIVHKASPGAALIMTTIVIVVLCSACTEIKRR